MRRPGLLFSAPTFKEQWDQLEAWILSLSPTPPDSDALLRTEVIFLHFVFPSSSSIERHQRSHASVLRLLVNHSVTAVSLVPARLWLDNVPSSCSVSQDTAFSSFAFLVSFPPVKRKLWTLDEIFRSALSKHLPFTFPQYSPGAPVSPSGSNVTLAHKMNFCVKKKKEKLVAMKLGEHVCCWRQQTLVFNDPATFPPATFRRRCDSFFGASLRLNKHTHTHTHTVPVRGTPSGWVWNGPRPLHRSFTVRFESNYCLGHRKGRTQSRGTCVSWSAPLIIWMKT